MTVAATLTQRQYTGTGTSAQFSFPNKIFSASDLVITIYDTSGNVYSFVNFANATLGWTYSVQNVDVDTGCIVVLSNVLTSGWVLDIRSLIPELQSTSVKNQGQFLPELHEEAFDRATRMIQDLLRLTYTFGIHGPDSEFTPWPALPTAALRKGYALMFDATTGLPGLGFLSAQNVTIGLLAPLLNLQQTAAEIVAGVTPVNFAYAPGNVLRYGADPTGVADSSAAFATAISCNDEIFDGYPGGGNYRFTSECSFTNYPLRIRGAVKNIGNIPGAGGTRITLASSVGAGKAHFHTTAFASGIRIESVSFFWQDVTLAQFGFRATSDLRASSILDCAFINTVGTINPAVNAISLEGAVIFTGAIAIRDNYFAGVHTAIALSGPCTTVRIRDNEIYGNLTGTNNGISIGASCLGVSIIGNTIEGWATAGVSNVGVITQIGNYFEGNGKDFVWTTSGNCSIGDFNPGGGSSTYTYNDASGNLVIGGAGYGIFADSQNANISRGIIDKFGTTGGYAAYGVWQTPTFAAGNFTGNGAMTWTVSSGNVSNAEYSVVGNTCNLHLEVDSSTVGGTPGTQLIYQMPLTAVSAAFFPCEVRVNGTRQTAVCQTSAGSKLLAIYVDATRATNWTASAANAGVSVNIAYRVNA